MGQFDDTPTYVDGDGEESGGGGCVWAVIFGLIVAVVFGSAAGAMLAAIPGM